MSIEFVVDLVRSQDNGATLERVAPTDVPGDVGARLQVVVPKVQMAANAANADAPVLAIQGNPYLAKDAYGEVLSNALAAATTDQKTKLGPTPQIHVDGLLPILHVYVPALDKWENLDGASLELDVSEASNQKGLRQTSSVRGLPDYYLSLRPRTQDPSTRCTYAVPTECGRRDEPVAGIVLFFSPTRTVIQSVRVPREHSRGEDIVGVALRNRQSRALLLPGPLFPKNAELQLEVRYVGDPPYLKWSTVLAEGAPDAELAPERGGPAEPFPVPPPVASPSSEQQLESYTYDFDEALEHRRALVAQTTEHRADHEFFLELDEATHPQIGKPSAGFDFVRLGLALASRYENRARHQHFGEDLQVGAEVIASQLAEAKAAGDLIRGLVRKWFGEDTGTTKLEKAAAAFERFAGGELALFDVHGVPNGTNIFSFAELAIFLIEAGVDACFWSGMLEIFGRAAEIFAVCYHGCKLPRTGCSYRVPHNPEGYRAPDAAYKADLAALWGTGARRRYRLVLQAALLDDLEGAFGPGQGGAGLVLEDLGC